MLLWVLSAVLAAAVVLLFIKLQVLRRSCREMARDLAERLDSDTNTLIDVSTGDRQVRALAAAINRELRSLRAQRRRYIRGDEELKAAVTNISHDLRTPLTAICGYLDLIEREDTSEAVRRYLDIIRGRAEALAGLTEELFRYSVIVSGPGGEPERLDVASVLEESLAASYTALRERGISPVVRMPEGPVVRTLDRSALTRVFGNLLSNAVRYSDGDLEVELDAAGRVTFTNTAAALDGVQVGRLFDRFYTVEAARDSTGLGLAIARTLTERMGGAMTASWQSGRLTVALTLPPEPPTGHN